MLEYWILSLVRFYYDSIQWNFIKIFVYEPKKQKFKMREQKNKNSILICNKINITHSMIEFCEFCVAKSESEC